MLDSKRRCCLGNADAGQQNRFLHSNRGCWTASRDAVQEVPMLDSKIVSCIATADARQQNQMLSRKTFAGFYEIVRETCIFSPRSSVLQIEGFSEKTSKTFTRHESAGLRVLRNRRWSTTIVPAHESKNSGDFGSAEGIAIYSRRRRSEGGTRGTESRLSERSAGFAQALLPFLRVRPVPPMGLWERARNLRQRILVSREDRRAWRRHSSRAYCFSFSPPGRRG